MKSAELDPFWPTEMIKGVRNIWIAILFISNIGWLEKKEKFHLSGWKSSLRKIWQAFMEKHKRMKAFLFF